MCAYVRGSIIRCLDVTLECCHACYSMIFQNIGSDHVNESKLAEDTESDAEEDAPLDVEEPASKDGNKESLAKSDATEKSMVKPDVNQPSEQTQRPTGLMYPLHVAPCSAAIIIIFGLDLGCYK